MSTTTANNSINTENTYSRFNEGMGIILLAFSLTIMLSLLSYDPQDPAWNVISTREQAVNWIGSVGAWTSDILFQLFGLSAFLIPILLTTVGWRTLRLREIRLLHRKFFGLVLMILSFASLLSLPQMPFYKENVQFGGAIGTLTAQFLEIQLNKTGTGIALVVLLVFSLMLITELSVNAVVESAGVKTVVAGTSAALLSIRGQIGSLHTNWTNFLVAKQKAKEERERLRQQLREEEAVKREQGRTARLKEEKLKSSEQIAKANIEENKKSSNLVTNSAAINKAVEINKATNPTDLKTPSSNLPPSPPTVAFNNIPSEPVIKKAVEVPVVGNFFYGNKRQPDLDELRRLVYGEEQHTETLEEFSLSGALPVLPPPVEVGRVTNKTPLPIADQNTVTNQVVVRKRSDTAKVPELQAPTKVPQSMRQTDIVAAPNTPSPLRKTSSNVDDNSSGIVINQPIVTDEQNKRPVSNSNYVPKLLPIGDFELPSLDILSAAPPKQLQNNDELMARAHSLVEKFKQFAVTGEVHAINPGPVVTTFEFKPDAGVKYSRVTSLNDDLCLALEAESVRIDRIPGKSTVGIEVPNTNREKIFLREVFESDKYQGCSSPLTLALGKGIDGRTYAADLAKMPHLLIAGATGTGKSVCLNSLIVSILYKASPDDVKMIMVDPKRLELGLYEGIPHLLTPIVLDPKRASNALKWAVGEMERRYKLLAGYSVRNIDQYNQQVRQEYEIIPAIHPDRLRKPLPYIVIIIDELADLMMVASKDVETSITRLAQMARAVGIHLVIATQRPSVDVITGLIKANFPSRLSFRVSSKVDSRTILDANGAETLLGQGDMLFLPPGTSRLVRVHGAYVGEREIEAIVEHIRSQRQPEYDNSIQASDEDEGGNDEFYERDELFDEALKVVCQMGKASTSVLQRRLRIGYGRAAAIIDMMEREGYVGPPDGSKPRIVKQSAYEYAERLEQLKLEEA